MNDTEYLQHLQYKLWNIDPHILNPYSGRKDGWYFANERRIILIHEFERVCDILSKDNDIVFEIHSDCLGFGIGMSIYTSKVVPRNSRLLHINQKHFSRNNVFDDAWPIFKQLAQIFKHKLLRPLQKKSYYEY